jgi:hypothetical protein
VTRYTPLWLQSGSYAASVDRRLIGALWPAARCDGLAVSSSGAGMGLNVAAGYCVIPAANGTGAVLCPSDATEVVTLDPAPPSGTNRIDLVICQSRGADLDGGTNNDFIFYFTKGTEAASPVAPATPPGALALAQVRVNGGAASVAAGDITDVRPASLAVPAAMAASTPRGHIASAVGPAATMNTASNNVCSITANVVAGRRYRITAFGSGAQAGTTGEVRFSLSGQIDGIQTRFQDVYAVLVGQNVYGTGVWRYTPGATGAQTWTLVLSTTAGTFNAAANASWLILEDIGV